MQKGKQRLHWIVSDMHSVSCTGKIEIATSKIKNVKQVKVLFTIEKLFVFADDVCDDVIQGVQQTGIKLYDINAAKSAAQNYQDNPFTESNPIIILIFNANQLGGFIDVKIVQIAFVLSALYGLTVPAVQLIKSGTLLG